MEDPSMRISHLIRIYFTAFWFIPTVLLMFTVGVAFGSAGGESGGVTVVPDWSVLIQIANFIFLIWVLNLILYRPIRNVLIQRKEKVAGLEASIGSFTRDLQEREEAFGVGIKEARSKGRQEKEALLDVAAEEEKKMIAKINEKLQADLVEVREKISKDAAEVRKSLLKEIDVFAESISQKILGRKVS
jgi:F-type H+-transporting ATPase subunit b